MRRGDYIYTETKYTSKKHLKQNQTFKIGRTKFIYALVTVFILLPNGTKFVNICAGIDFQFV